MTEYEGAFDASLYVLCTDMVVQDFESRSEESERNEFTCLPLFISTMIYH